MDEVENDVWRGQFLEVGIEIRANRAFLLYPVLRRQDFADRRLPPAAILSRVRYKHRPVQTTRANERVSIQTVAMYGVTK